jgi:hypothetical protein
MAVFLYVLKLWVGLSQNPKEQFALLRKVMKTHQECNLFVL